MTKNIYLLGMPSSGKSTLGKQIAKSLEYDFIDLDTRITAAEGKSVLEIFKMNGEEYFRKLETEQLKKIPAHSKVVIATGGGTPCYNNNIEYIKENGVSIFLDVPPDKIFERMQNSKKNDRPMFDLENSDLLSGIEEVYNHRGQFYRQADLLIEGDTNAEGILWILEYQGNLK
jgi:shikimate kinase